MVVKCYQSPERRRPKVSGVASGVFTRETAAPGSSSVGKSEQAWSQLTGEKMPHGGE